MKKFGWGISLIYYPTGLAGGGDTTQAFVKLKADGGADLFLASNDLGQGVRTVAMQILSEETGIPMDQIVIHSRTTDETPICSGTFASRCTFFAGNAVKNAGQDLRRQMCEHAAPMLGVTPEALSFEDGKIFVTEDPEKKMLIAELAGAVIWGAGAPLIGKGYHAKEPARVIDAEKGQLDVITALAYGATLAELTVDTETGEVDIQKLYNVYDAGKVINPMLAEAQINGGVVMAVGSSLSENIYPDYPTDKWRPKAYSEYYVPTAMDLPPMESVLVEYPSRDGPYGAKGIGEMTTNSASPAILNAIHDAIGVWICDAPATPERILKALAEKEEKESAC